MADNLGANPSPPRPADFPREAAEIVREHVSSTLLEKTDPPVEFEVYVVWFAFVLGNWKAMVSTTLPDGRYYEVTRKGDGDKVFLDEYVKINNREVR